MRAQERRGCARHQQVGTPLACQSRLLPLPPKAETGAGGLRSGSETAPQTLMMRESWDRTTPPTCPITPAPQARPPTPNHPPKKAAHPGGPGGLVGPRRAAHQHALPEGPPHAGLRQGVAHPAGVQAVLGGLGGALEAAVRAVFWCWGGCSGAVWGVKPTRHQPRPRKRLHPPPPQKVLRMNPFWWTHQRHDGKLWNLNNYRWGGRGRGRRPVANRKLPLRNRQRRSNPQPMPRCVANHLWEPANRLSHRQPIPNRWQFPANTPNRPSTSLAPPPTPGRT